jgi:hypothetical protein
MTQPDRLHLVLTPAGEFLRLLDSNDATDCDDDDILIPCQNEIKAAQPFARVLPEDVMRQVTVVASMLFGGGLNAIQQALPKSISVKMSPRMSN